MRGRKECARRRTRRLSHRPRAWRHSWRGSLRSRAKLRGAKSKSLAGAEIDLAHLGVVADRRRRRRRDPRQRPGARGLFRHRQDFCSWLRATWLCFARSRAMSDAMLAVDGLSAWYGAARILYDLSFEVGRGEVVALMGRNGAGKSTTLKAVMGLIAERQGKVRFNGGDISHLKPFEIARRGLGFTPEDRRIFVDLTVLENLDVGRQPPRSFADGTHAPSWTPASLFALFPNLAEMPNRLGGRMSGGEQQMLTVARTLM